MPRPVPVPALSETAETLLRALCGALAEVPLARFWDALAATEGATWALLSPDEAARVVAALREVAGAADVGGVGEDIPPA